MYCPAFLRKSTQSDELSSFSSFLKQKKLESDELFSQLIQNYMQNLQMSVSQEQNAQIGKIGVQPVT